jgi:hypothetical protein
MFAEAIAKVYNSMVVTELPTYLHVRCLLERIDPELRTQKKNFAAQTPDINKLQQHAFQLAFDKNIHSRFHNDSCVNKYLPYCR